MRDSYEGFQKKDQTLAMLIDLEDAYNRARSMDLLVQDEVSLAVICSIAAAPLENNNNNNKNSGHTTWKVGLRSSSVYHGLTPRLAAPATLLQRIQQDLPDVNQTGCSRVAVRHWQTTGSYKNKKNRLCALKERSQSQLRKDVS